MQEAKAASVRVRALLNANRKKSVHISLFAKTHMGFKKELVGRGLSMQETFEYFASLVVDGFSGATKMLDDLERQKRVHAVEKLEEKYTENLYDAIGFDNPFEEDK